MLSLSALSPFGPIFGKELRTTARRKRTYILRVGYLAGLLLLLLLAYSETSRSNTTSVAQRQSEQAELGTVFFACFSMFCVIAMALIGPVLTATAISSERSQKTLHVLLMTPINSWQIISGKLFSRLLVALTLIGLSLPALAVARLLGGVELDQMFAVICLCAVTALSSAAIGLFFSTLMTRAYAVILLSYATLALIYLFVPFILIAWFASTRGGGGRSMALFEVIGAIAPPYSVIMVISGRNLFGSVSWVASVAVALGLTAVLVLLCGLMLRRIARTAGESGNTAAPPPMPPELPIAALAPPGIPALLSGDALAADALPLPPLEETGTAPAPAPLPYARHSIGRTVADNPVLWRELRRPLMTKRWQAIVGSVCTVLLLVISYIALYSADNSALRERDTQIGFAIIFNGVLMLLVCVVSATAIAGEKESDTWTLLLATPLSATEIVRGKFLGLLRRMVWPFALIVAHFVLFTFTGAISLGACVVTLWVMFSFNLIWVATGLYLSLRLKHVTFAVILNLLLPVLAYLLALVLLAIAGSLFNDRADRLPEFVGWYAPYPYLVSAIHGLGRPQGYGSLWLPGSRSNDVTPGAFCTAVFLVGSAYLLATYVILKRSIKRFDRIVGRSPQTQTPLHAATPPTPFPT